ncbi:phage tail protein [Paenibacillus motobuensis]|uniref:Tail fiber protein n=1 Tax=Paenibacillus motobuensis TaxID=295324 RepID=A0ABN0YAW8_9BACL
MAKTDWRLTDVVKPEDMNNLGQEINDLRSDLSNVEIPPASLTQPGIVQLSNSTTGTREDVAATEKAVKDAFDRAEAAFQAGNERKKEVVDALIAIGVSASLEESWSALISKMATVIKATGNSTIRDVLAGKTFSNATGNGLTGTMPNQGSKVITPSTSNQAILAGYHDGTGYVKGDANLVAGNLPKDISIFGVTGLLERLTTADRNAIISAIVAKGVAASAADTNLVLAQKIGQINIKQASGNTGGNSVEINNLAFSPLVVMIKYNGNFRSYYDSDPWNARSVSVSGDAYFIKGVNTSSRLSSSTTTGRDGDSNLEVSASITWSPNGFTISVSPYTYSYTTISANISSWYALGL